MRKFAVGFAALVASAIPVLSGGADAETITYTFTGVGTFSLDGTDYTNADFTVTMVSDTTTVTSGGGEVRNTGTTTFTTGSTSDTITDAVVIENTAAPGFMGFAQAIAPFPDESLTAAIFQTYDLITSLGLTSGGLSVAGATFQTGGGTLVFVDDEPITSLSFEATLGAVPEPSTWAMMLIGFGGLGFLGYRRTLKGQAAA